MRAEFLPGFARACHARRILTGFCPRTPCAPNSCRVSPAHAMRAKFLPGFASKRILATKTCRVLLQKEFWQPKPAGFRFKKNFDGRNLPGFASKRILTAERHQGVPAKFTWYPAKLPCPGWGLGRRPTAPQQFNNSTNKHLNTSTSHGASTTQQINTSTPPRPPVQTAGRLIPVILR